MWEGIKEGFLYILLKLVLVLLAIFMAVVSGLLAYYVVN